MFGFLEYIAAIALKALYAGYQFFILDFEKREFIW
jgi:hypothetical protein